MIHHQPAKYHTNPLTHFLNLHSSHATAAAAAAAAAAALDQHQQSHLHYQQQHQHPQQHPLHHPVKLGEDLNLLNNNNNEVVVDAGVSLDGDECDRRSHHDPAGVHSNLDIENTDTNDSNVVDSDTENNNIDVLEDDDDEEEDEDLDEDRDGAESTGRLMDNHTPSTTPLVDADGIGKSFTIAAILGLKKKQNVVVSETHNFSDVMNLSLNNNQSVHGADSGESGFQPQRGSSASPTAGPTPHLSHNHHTLGSSLVAMQTLHQIHGAAMFHQQHQHPVQQQQQGLPLTAQHPQQQTTTAQGTTQQQQQQQQPQPSHLVTHHHYHHSHHPHHPHHGHHHPHHHHHHHQLAMAAHHHAQNHNRDKFKDLSKKSSLSSSAALKSKRVRTIFTPEQLERLEAEFERQQYMVGPERLYLAHTLQLTEAQVKVWFQNRRIKWRKHHLEITQQRLALIRQRQIASGGVVSTQPNVGVVGVGGQMSPGSATGATTSQQQQQQQQIMAGGRMMLGGAESPELTICTDSLETRSVSESDD